MHAVCHQWYAAQHGIWGDVEMVLGDQSNPANLQFGRWCAAVPTRGVSPYSRPTGCAHTYTRCTTWFCSAQPLRSTAHTHSCTCSPTFHPACSVPTSQSPAPCPQGRPHSILLAFLTSTSSYRDVTHALAQSSSLVHLSLTVASVASPVDLDPLASPRLHTCTLRVAQPCAVLEFFPFVQHCNALHSLDIAVDNQTVCAAPEWLGTLSRLQRLSLRGVNLNAVPDALTQLTDLTDLDLSFNSPPLETFPRTLAGMKALRRVVLHNALTHHVPTALSTLPALQHLDVAYNCQRGGPAPSTSPSDSPRTLQRTLLRVPLTMGKTLVDLCLSSNTLPTGHLAALLPRLPALRRLDLSGCGLAVLPPSLTVLTALEHLDASGNDLHVLPVTTLLTLPKLHTLHCLGNAAMRLMPEALSLACHPGLLLIDLRREDGPGPTHWDAPSLLVLVHLTWLMLRSRSARSVWVGCERGVVVDDGVYQGEFGGGPMERAVEAHVQRTHPNFCADLDALRASVAAQIDC